MNLDKAKKRIAKQVKKGFKGYPQITIAYFGQTNDLATEVIVTFILEEGSQGQEQKLISTNDVREDENIQSVLVRIIDRAQANTVLEIEGVTVK